MPLQYFYPSGEYSVTGTYATPSQSPGQLYTTIDEGVQFSNDSDYITLSGNSIGNYNTVVYFNNLLTKNNIITVRSRTSFPDVIGLTSGTIGSFTIPGVSGSYISAPLNSGAYTYEFTLPYDGVTDLRNKSGIFSFTNIYPTKLNIYSLEIMMSGTTISGSINNIYIDSGNYHEYYYYPIADYGPADVNGVPSGSSNYYTRLNDINILTTNDTYVKFNNKHDTSPILSYGVTFNLSGSLFNQPITFITLSIIHSGMTNQSGTISFTTGSIPNSIPVKMMNSANQFTQEFYTIYNTDVPLNSLFYGSGNLNVTFQSLYDTGNPGAYSAISHAYILVASGARVDKTSPTLAITGCGKSSGNTTLYMSGYPFAKTTMPLFITTVPIFVKDGNSQLYIKSFGSPNPIGASGATIFMPCNNFYSGSMNLFIPAASVGSLGGNNANPLNLYIGSFGSSATSGMPLFLKTFFAGLSGNNTYLNTQNNTTLFTQSKVNFSGGMNLVIPGPLIDRPNSYMSLFLKGKEFTPFIGNVSGNNSIPIPGNGQFVPLFMANNFGSGNKQADLIIKNVNLQSGLMNLILNNGQTGGLSGSTTLFVSQKSNVNYLSGNTNLITFGGTTNYLSSNMNLFISGRTIDTAQNSTNMFVYAGGAITPSYLLISSSDTFLLDPIDQLYLDGGLSNVSQIYRYSPLFLQSDNFNSNVSLYVRADGNNPSTNTSISLFIKNGDSLFSAANLSILNNTQTKTSGTTLRVIGTGLNDGFNFGSQSMNLYLGRKTSSVDNRTNLFLKCKETISNNAPMIISGGTYLNKNATLAIPKVISKPSGHTTLYVHGY